MGTPLVGTLTLNPALDLTLQIDSLHPGEVHRALSSRVDPGGKGINVSRVLSALGVEVQTLALLAGESGGSLARMLERMGFAYQAIPCPGETRTNVAFTEPDGRQTKVNQAGPHIDAATADAIRLRVRETSLIVKFLVLSGRLPPGLPVDFYAELIHIAAEGGAKAVLDADGAALAEGIRAAPFLIKPNRRELEELMGTPLPRREDVLRAAHDLRRRGVGNVIISLGEEGALAVGESSAWHARAPKVKVLNQVGLGDSLVAGVVCQLARGAGLREALRWGVAAGAASAAAPPVELCNRKSVERLAGGVLVDGLPL